MQGKSSLIAALAGGVLLSGCSVEKSETAATTTTQAPTAPAAPAATAQAAPDPFASNDTGTAAPQDKPRPVMQLQVVLDRLGFSPGVVDGKEGMSTRNGLTAFQEARGLKVTGQADEATRAALAEYEKIPATRLVTIPEDFAAGPFVKIPATPEEKAKLEGMNYESLAEKLAERFHTTEAVLKELNPDVAEYKAGQELRVPNVGADQIEPGSVENESQSATLKMLGIGTRQAQAARLMVDESDKMLRVYDEAGKVIAAYTVSTGSKRNPLPIGDWTIQGVAFNPDYSFDPSVLSTVDESKAKQTFPPGPNSPVGVVWIDLSKDHYGLHGTPGPETIGRAQSDGCVRLTNWDAARLALMVKPGTKVTFQK